MKNISILGSTGSIGTQTLEVINELDNFKIVGLSANKNIDLLEKQALKYKPKIVAVYDESRARILRERLNIYNIKVVSGMDGLIEVATEKEADIVLTSVVGMIGLLPTLEAIKSGKIIALANKETLVTAGEIVMRKAKENNVDIIPVDSEHSAIFQSLKSGKKEEVAKIILTASGGPFRGKKLKDLEKVSVSDALKHPNWSMGRKISIDSATLMNKGLEVIEAKWLFDVDIENIEVIIHPQSIIHSMVEFIDGSVIAQLGVPDMKVPIQYALTYPKRKYSNIKKLRLTDIKELTFEEPDLNTFPCLKLAFEALKQGGTMPSVLNAANEVAVKLFLDKKIKFLDIPKLIEETMLKHKTIYNPNLDDIIESDKWARESIVSKYDR
ncbi:1-deoxy-D-xylulose 5-phosphate reductoisomerase [Caloranaerobacter azorensis DSM 13643]|uniref:1-deoxy-D-xylulose 5-phosphate reductoisomerase n=1 Tax=Caloranaerobacter azorensis DSM 13643 TaxID=1121264 RepID=A0A1M5VED8_9FIRM|nr:1-deoxy-D-xylulose-5-phosphate reductoisomerase [Caloranaerobacter azorensis]SHH73528.1 1-deoxy-D-xylulose 5-phosphate reductoisomerase [Caloranaerobacter azorensis DSM 13643]